MYRLKDHFDGRKGSYNISDFIAYQEGHLFILEAKSVHGKTFNIKSFSQYDRLREVKVKGAHPMVVIWFVDYDKVIAFPITSVEQMEKDGLKSIHIDTYMNYTHIDVPSVKKRIFMDSDYTCVLEYYKNLDKEKEVKE